MFFFFLFYLALILREEGEVQQSLDVFQQCVQLNQHNPDHLKQVARSLYAFIFFKKLILGFSRKENCNPLLRISMEISRGQCKSCLRGLNQKLRNSKGVNAKKMENPGGSASKILNRRGRGTIFLSGESHCFSISFSCFQKANFWNSLLYW